jgi:hypothetical protein
LSCARLAQVVVAAVGATLGTPQTLGAAQEVVPIITLTMPETVGVIQLCLCQKAMAFLRQSWESEHLVVPGEILLLHTRLPCLCITLRREQTVNLSKARLRALPCLVLVLLSDLSFTLLWWPHSGLQVILETGPGAEADV